MALDQLLLDLLVCPVDKQSLWYFEGDEVLYNPRTHVVYAITEGIPVLLPAEGRSASDDERVRFEAKKDGAVETGLGSAAS